MYRHSFHQITTQLYTIQYNSYVLSYRMYVVISFELPSEEDLQSAGGVEFSTDQSRIYIPYSAIQHQKETEGTATYIRMHTITTS